MTCSYRAGRLRLIAEFLRHGHSPFITTATAIAWLDEEADRIERNIQRRFEEAVADPVGTIAEESLRVEGGCPL